MAAAFLLVTCDWLSADFDRASFIRSHLFTTSISDWAAEQT